MMTIEQYNEIMSITGEGYANMTSEITNPEFAQINEIAGKTEYNEAIAAAVAKITGMTHQYHRGNGGRGIYRMKESQHYCPVNGQYTIETAVEYLTHRHAIAVINAA